MNNWLILALALSFPTFASAADQKGPPPGGGGGGQMMHKGPTKDEREKMAALHEKFAVCARSDRQMRECGEEFQSGCKALNGKCGPGSGPGKGGPGKGGPGGGMGGQGGGGGPGSGN